jgi:YVTN family beta-propeller protein
MTLADAGSVAVLCRLLAITLLAALLLPAPRARAGELAWITNQTAGTVSVIDLDALKVIATIDVPAGPAGVAVTRDGSRVYVTHPDLGLVSEIDGVTRQLVKSIEVGGSPFGIALDERERRLLFVTDWSRHILIVIDPKKGIPLDLLAVGQSPAGIAVDEMARRVYIADRESGTVTVLDADVARGYAQFSVGSHPFGVALDTRADRLYVGNVRSGSLSIVDTRNHATLAEVPIGDFPYGMAVGPDGKVYVANQRDDAVAVLDPVQAAVTARQPVGRYPDGLAIDAAGKRLVVANWFDDSVTVLGLPGLETLAVIPVGAGCRAFGRFIGPDPAAP